MTVRKIFETELAALNAEVVSMCRLAESMTEDMFALLKEPNAERSIRLSETDKRVDEYELDIERRCMRMLIKQQPVAKDFRDVAAALKLITDVERICDQASDIALLLAEMTSDNRLPIPKTLLSMGELANAMVNRSCDAFIKEDAREADAVTKTDDVMDDLFSKAKKELIALMKKNSTAADDAVVYLMIAKYLERIGDHAVNVCEWSKYHETGVRKKYQ